MKRRFWLALGAIAATLGLGLTTSVPAQALSLSTVVRCNWPLKATIDLVGDSSSYGYSWRAYSPTGYYLGSYYGRTWYTPWEDVTVFVSTNDPSYDFVKWCR